MNYHHSKFELQIDYKFQLYLNYLCCQFTIMLLNGKIAMKICGPDVN